ncbi:MAG: ATP-binding protein [Desulfobacteraceae bacterium]|jgi:signal transduction histidine kinase/CheY-like chemotaxis protein
MNEIEAIRWHLSRYRGLLNQQVDRLYNALEELQRTTLLLLELHSGTDDRIDAWLREEGFEVDDDGFFQSRPLLSAFRNDAAPADAVSVSWGKHLRTDPVARRHMFCHRRIGPLLKHIHDRLGDVAWIYYQDASNTSLQYPYIDQRSAIAWDFDWTAYHTFVSVCPENNPTRCIQWTMPTIDYAGEGLILSVSIPVWRDDGFIGLWSIDLPVRYLYRNFISSKVFPEQDQFIVNDQGMLLLHEKLQFSIDQQKGRVFLRPLSDLGGDWGHFDLDRVLAKDAGALKVKDARGVRWVFCCTHVPRVEWTLFCGLPETSMEEAAAQRLRQAFQQIGDGNFSQHIEFPSSNEFLSTLFGEFNKMSLRLRQAEQHRDKIENQLRQAQRLEAIGRLAGGVAHDYNNMTNVIIGFAELTLECLDKDDPIHENLQEIQAAAKRSAEITRQLLAFARCQPIAPKVLDLNQTVDSMLSMLKRLIGEDIELAWHPGPSIWPVKIDPSQIDQILANLCVNARDAISDVGRVVVETENIKLDEAYCANHQGFVPGEYVQLSVSDDGMGMDTATMDKIFEPFFSTKKIGQGTGLGLSTVYGIVKQNGGFINVYSEPEVGTTFKVYLARTSKATIKIPLESAAKAPLGRGETLLLVEDEEALLRLVQKMLKKLGFRVLTANTPAKAITLAQQHPQGIDLLVTDVVMPELNGRELANRLHTLIPRIRVLFMSGYTPNIIANRGILDEDVCVIQKPFSSEQLVAKVKEALDRDYQGH